MPRWATTGTQAALTAVALCLAVVPVAAGDDEEAAVAQGPELTRVIVLSPKPADSPDTTHATLLITRDSYAGRIAFAGRVQTVRQLRAGSPANAWECAWLVWNYADDQHFYYVAIKPTGWEIGKRDPAYPGGQRFLASGDDGYALGAWHDFAIAQENGVITIRLNGIEIAPLSDTERPYASGRLGLYAEDAEVQLDDVIAPFADDFESYQLLTDTTDGLVIGPWVVPFLGYGSVAIADRKR